LLGFDVKIPSVLELKSYNIDNKKVTLNKLNFNNDVKLGKFEFFDFIKDEYGNFIEYGFDIDETNATLDDVIANIDYHEEYITEDSFRELSMNDYIEYNNDILYNKDQFKTFNDFDDSMNIEQDSYFLE